MTEQKISVLLIEDNPGDARLVREMLAEAPGAPFQLERMDRLSKGLARMAAGALDVLLLDLDLPDSRGLDTLRRVRAQNPEAAIVVLTGLSEESVALEAMRQGAHEYMIKGNDSAKTLARVIRYAMARKHMEAAIRSQSLTDELTGLYNRRGFLALGQQQLRLMHRQRSSISLFFADLDKLKIINDTHGHAAGDEALKKTAQILREIFRESDIVARIGGDEFAVITANGRPGDPDRFEKRLKQRLKEHNARRKEPYELSLSIGAAVSQPGELASIEKLMAQADKVLYKKKPGASMPPPSSPPTK